MDAVLAMNDIEHPGLTDTVEGDLETAREGDAGAFERLYRAHVGKVFALCLRLTGDRIAAEERTQDTFVRAWEKLASFRGESRFSTWLHSLAVNEVLMAARSGNRRTARLVPVEDTGRAPDPLASSDPGVSMDLERALCALPEGARRAFVLHDVYGYGHGEIARMTGSSPGTSKTQLHRARTLLMEALR